ncbi:hypothetical protein A2U01_0088196, partial [Trifolium medium]|nr:hypothetical protein [Trifolium medium]
MSRIDKFLLSED